MANAVNYILQGVLTTGTAANVGGLNGRQAAGKTGTSNVANGFGTPYAAFAGYTPSLVGYVSVFNPISPTVHDTMGGSASCYRLEFGGLDCPGEMFGANAPASTWHMTFDHANLGPVTYFVPVPADSPFNRLGNGRRPAAEEAAAATAERRGRQRPRERGTAAVGPAAGPVRDH